MRTALAHPGDQKHTQTPLFKKGIERLGGFITKVNNDWVLNSASALAYNLMVAMVPIAVALFFVLGITLGRLNPTIQTQLINGIDRIFPSAITSKDILQPAFISLQKNVGLLGILAVLASIFGGSRLFISIEGYFDIIYRTYPRKIIAQNVTAILMMLVFIALTPLMLFASSVPVLILALARNTALQKFPEIAGFIQNGLLLSAASVSGSLIVSGILLETIYLVIPNQHISFKNSWPGAVIGAVLLQLFLFFFPFYIAHFMGSYQGNAGFAIILLVFFYYFAVILLLGAEVNAYFAEKLPPLENNLAVIIHDVAPRRAPNSNEQTPTDISSSNETGVNSPVSEQRAITPPESDITNTTGNARSRDEQTLSNQTP